MYKYILGAGFIVYLWDCYHVWCVYSENEKYLNGVEPSEEELKELKQRYSSLFINQVSKDDFSKRKDQFLKARRAAQLKVLKTGTKNEFLLSRESIPFFFGARAAFLQLAHPYIASAIVQHSNVKRDIHKRFLNTFKYLFSMSFDDDDKALKSARTVRLLHDQVIGELQEDIGQFKAGHKYDASNLHALYWVYQTLCEGSVLAFEIFVRRLSDSEKERAYKHQFILATGFGIPQDYFPNTQKQFKRQYGVFLNSGYLAIGSDASNLKQHLLFTNRKSSKKNRILEYIVTWLTLMTLPKKIAAQYFNRIPTRIETLIFIAYCGWIRFVYRLLPNSFRFLNAYLNMKCRLGIHESFMNRAMRLLSGMVATGGVKMLLSYSI